MGNAVMAGLGHRWGRHLAWGRRHQWHLPLVFFFKLRALSWLAREARLTPIGCQRSAGRLDGLQGHRSTAPIPVPVSQRKLAALCLGLQAAFPLPVLAQHPCRKACLPPTAELRGAPNIQAEA
ncbi:hypothetical protein NDU88_004576 [Pleurodeles waltl]|uniref:Uncharacterized protein n=1 Tax=Pleurodeles waltl TaxID=8319 RepID=A0AAV7W9H6_PLEWA|nr:hypothetical protein NDU88_004576 [Pleurodeles waltl]